jgi:hypothetical protein
LNRKKGSVKRKNALLVAVIFTVAFPLVGASASEGIPSDQLARDKETLRTLLPKETESAGWKGASSPEFFEPENLWEYINGQAEVYLDYGLKLVLTTDYTSLDSSSSMAVEIYQMQSPDHAFGIYAAERSPDDNFINMGVQGYLAEDVLNFWKGHYYVKLTSFQRSSDTKEILMRLAAVIANKIEGSYSEPELFACFPEKNRVKLSERFIPKNFLGQRFLKNGYQVEYKNGGSSYQVFLVNNASRQEAEEAFGKYQNFLESQNRKIFPVRKDDYQLICTKGEKGKLIFQYGSFVGGVLNSEDLSEAERIVAEIVHKLRNRSQ